MTDTGPRRHDAEIIEGQLSPAQESITLPVALHLLVDVIGKSFRHGILVNHDRMVDDQVDRNLRVDLLRISAGTGHGVAHRCQIDNGGHAGEVLHQHPGRPEGDFMIGGALIQPVDNCVDVICRD